MLSKVVLFSSMLSFASHQVMMKMPDKATAGESASSTKVELDFLSRLDLEVVKSNKTTWWTIYMC